VSEWSAGTPVEHSILNAYLEAIAKAEHFIYIEVSPTFKKPFTNSLTNL